ncbi:MAG TPA: acetyltransferase [Gemmatimonadaceae bacterium]|nr:acetyltransferase [Gemmatimonadaceae bacterium]
MPATERILIIGASGHGRVAADAAAASGLRNVVGFLDARFPELSATAGIPVLGREQDCAELVRRHRIDGVVVAVGDNWTRSQVVEHLRSAVPDLRFATVIHPRACVARDATLGPGSVAFAGAVVNPGARVGSHVIVNTAASIDHDCTVEDFASLAPHAVLGGGTTVGAYAAVGIGAIAIHNVQIGAHTVVGAGSVVLRSLPPSVVAMGVPARVVHRREVHERYL